MLQSLYPGFSSQDFVTDKILPQLKEWPCRPLKPVYPFVFMDCIHYKVREDGRILSRAAYVVPGFKEAIQTVFPKAEIQRCVIHMLRNSFKYVSYKDLKKFASDFKAVYNAPNEAAALSELENIKETLGRKIAVRYNACINLLLIPENYPSHKVPHTPPADWDTP